MEEEKSNQNSAKEEKEKFKQEFEKLSELTTEDYSSLWLHGYLFSAQGHPTGWKNVLNALNHEKISDLLSSLQVRKEKWTNLIVFPMVKKLEENKKRKYSESSESSDFLHKEELEKMSLKKLKLLCRERNLKGSGKKASIVRLLCKSKKGKSENKKE